jgi:hypothetical protein
MRIHKQETDEAWYQQPYLHVESDFPLQNSNELSNYSPKNGNDA